MKWFQSRSIEHGDKVFVYFNLREKCFSVRAMQGVHKGKVVAHTDKIVLAGDVEFVVGQKGRERVLREQQKNVHAGVMGELDLSNNPYTVGEEIKYNPYKYDSFVVYETKEPIQKGEYVLLEEEKIYLLKKDS